MPPASQAELCEGPLGVGALPWGEPLASLSCAYKVVRLDVVARRAVTLYADRLTTARVDSGGATGHSGSGAAGPPAEPKTWLLARECKLQPEYAEEIVPERPERLILRAPHAWSVTAKLGSMTGSGTSGSAIDLVRAAAVHTRQFSAHVVYVCSSTRLHVLLCALTI
jgi:hypothetical protein